ncbi:TetR/AcrR family transcriptional regulator [Aliirhizobium terrae]|uniref:TetR/AcrR family transcriptional regulator n=1 Tax=Terrirhizobium terrae TaxID=2926709 RepID=UPI002579119E|nr:TetR/AcrR family transcriptional regulator [Rhizobium sp. CC-CFT758]WJH39339.1 TetR/AcrR family transcriptional regulator [Rhizobium sp. CC-CFT758]
MEQTTAQKILASARSLIMAGGYNGFSYADISDAIGIRKASIHHHFPTKAALVSTLVEQYAQEAATALGAVRENIPDPVDQLQAYIGHWKTCIGDGSQPFCVCAMLAGEMEILPPEVAAHVQVHFRNLAAWLTAVLEEGATCGQFQLDKLPEEMAQILMASVHGAMLSARALGTPDLFGAIVAPQIEALLAKKN